MIDYQKYHSDIIYIFYKSLMSLSTKIKFIIHEQRKYHYNCIYIYFYNTQVHVT